MCYIQICFIMRCVIKGLQCIMFFFNRDLMQLESCIFTNLSIIYPTSTPTVSLHHIPPALRELFKSYKENGHQLLRESMTKMARCGSERENGCSGHSYGLIVCESSGNRFPLFIFYCKFGNNRVGFIFAKLRIPSFVKIKSWRNDRITLSFTDIGKSCPSSGFLRHKYVFKRYSRQ